MLKARILQHLQMIIDERIEESRASMASLRASRDNDSKSTAGDKHEVGRAMAQTELDNIEAQHARHLQSRTALDKIHMDRNNDEVGVGSMVETDMGLYFIAIGLGVIEVDGQKIYVVSPASPIGKLLNGERVGGKVDFNGRTIEVQTIR